MSQSQASGWGAPLAPAELRAPSPGSLEGSPVPSPYPAPPMPPPSAMPFQPRAPMGLSIRGFLPPLPPSPAFEEGPPAYLSEGVDAASEDLVRRTFAPSENFHNYRSLIYNIKNRATGRKKRLRKVANKERNISNFPGMTSHQMENLYDETKDEIDIYNTLRQFPGSERYIMPVVGTKSTPRYASINFRWLDGEDLLTYSQQEGQVLANVLKALRGAAEALRWLAENGYVHGDIKPDNFFVGTDGTVRLMDLGRATKDAAVRLKFDDRRAFIQMVHAMGFNFNYQSQSENQLDPKLISFYTAFIDYAKVLLDRAAAKAAAAQAAQPSPSRGGRRRGRASRRRQTKRRKRRGPQ